MTLKKKSVKTHPIKKVEKPMKQTAPTEPEEPKPAPEPEPEEEEESEDEPPETEAKKASSWCITYKHSPGKQPATSHSFASKKEAEEFIKARGWAWACAVEK